MRRSRKALATQVADHAARLERLVEEREEYKAQALANAGALRTATRQLSELKDELALHILAAEHPDSALSDARSMATSLREHLAIRGIDLRIELDRAERSSL